MTLRLPVLGWMLVGMPAATLVPCWHAANWDRLSAFVRSVLF